MVAGLSESEATRIAKALGDRIRLRTYGEIAAHKEICVGSLKVCEVVSHATVSHHLRVLSQAGLLASHRSGQYIFYRVIPSRLVAYRRYLSRLGKPSA